MSGFCHLLCFLYICLIAYNLTILFLHLFRISEEEYVNAITEEISKVVKLQEDLDIDVLVHGEPEVKQIYAVTYASK